MKKKNNNMLLCCNLLVITYLNEIKKIKKYAGITNKLVIKTNECMKCYNSL